MREINRPFMEDRVQSDFTETIDSNVLDEIRNRFGIALKGIFWRKF
jgi:hypothetical protein